jgi:hypothetical protein
MAPDNGGVFMSIGDEKNKRFLANSLFPSFFYAALGVVLTQAGAAQIHGSWGLHAFVGIPGLVLSGLALFRARLHWPAATTGMQPSRSRALGWGLLLVAAGASIGVLVSAGSVLLVGMAVPFTYLLPWAKIPMCRRRFAVSSLAMLAGAIAWVVIRGRPAQPLYFMIAAWMLYLPPMCMHVLILVTLDRGYRIHESPFPGKPEDDAHVRAQL